MTVQHIEHVGVVVDEFAAATAFFAELGLEPQSEGRSMALGSAAWWVSKASPPRVQRRDGDLVLTLGGDAESLSPASEPR